MATYNQRQLVNNILGKKNEWDNATDDNARQRISQSAQKYYEQLRNSGDSVLADNLSSRNSVDARKYADDFYKMLGKTQARPYLTSKGKAYGLSDDAINKAITFDESTNTVFLGGKSLGTPHSIVNGTSYWDQAKLDDAWNGYVKDNGLNKTLKNQFSDDKNKYYDMVERLWALNNDDKKELFDEYKKSPFSTDEAKEIMKYFGIEADNAALNVAANAAASNGGNIDSFAAANARRNRQATISRGLMTALDYNDRKWGKMSDATKDHLSTALGILQNLGVNVNNFANTSINWETADANNELTRANAREVDARTTAANTESEIAKWRAVSDITGKVSSDLAGANNPYLNYDGTLNPKYKDINFQERIEYLEANNPDGRYDDLIRELKEARIGKMNTYSDEYEQYFNQGNVASPNNQHSGALNADMQTKENDRALSKELAQMGYDNEEKEREWQSGENAEDRQNSLDVIKANGQNEVNQINAESDADISQGKAATDEQMRYDTFTKNLLSNSGIGVGEQSAVDSSGKLVVIEPEQEKTLVQDMNKWRTSNWKNEYGEKYTTGMFSGTQGSYKLDTGKSTTEWVLNYLLEHNCSKDLATSLLARWGISDDEIKAAASRLEVK